MRLVEACCGSAALTYHLLGSRRRLVPYQGNKWRFRRELADMVGSPSRYLLVDPGPWGIVAPALLRREVRGRVVEDLRRMVEHDPRDLHDELQGRSVPPGLSSYCAEFLWLQRLAFSSKAVGEREGCWSSPGLNTTSAYGVPATERFGAVRPLVPALIEALESMTMDVAAEGHHGRAIAIVDRIGPDDVVYIDPPYLGTTGYPGGGFDRADVVSFARECRARGARVIISEAEPIAELGWHTYRLADPTAEGCSFRLKAPEWLTMSEPVAAPGKQLSFLAP